LRARLDLKTYASIIDIPNRKLGKSIKAISEEEKNEFQFIPRSFARHHLLWLECLQQVADGKIQRLMGLMPPGSAKALSLETPIPTPDGWKLMGELKVGDKVFGDDGKPCNVTWVSPIWKDRPVYKVTTDCGDEIIADKDHEWLVLLSNKIGRKFSLKTTEFLAHTGLRGHERKIGKRSKRPMVKRAAALDLPEINLVLDPYLLGLWLGDGSKHFPSLACGEKDIEWVVPEINRLGVNTSKGVKGTNYTVGLLGIRHLFRQLGLMGGSCGSRAKTKLWGKKFIPQPYLRASKEQRKALLQGLIDTDGTVSEAGHIVFTNTNYDLVCGVAELVRSLGVKASISTPYTPI
jgi:hypothetical protein